MDDKEHTHDYLIQCRLKLMHKVQRYKSELDKAIEENIKMTLMHKKELERVRRFYMYILYMHTYHSHVTSFHTHVGCMLDSLHACVV